MCMSDSQQSGERFFDAGQSTREELIRERGGSGDRDERDDLARASESRREYYAAIGIYGQPWCERWNGEMWGHWRDQADGFFE